MPKQKILVVDDDANLVQALRLRLLANDFDIAVACDGYAAVATAQKERPDLIILDLGLPAGDGFVVLAILFRPSPAWSSAQLHMNIVIQ